MGVVTFISNEGNATEVDAEAGVSIMQIATAKGITGIVAECGGSMSCATCHIYVDEAWLDKTGSPSAAEANMLEFAEDPGPTSRLSCQIRYTAQLDGLIVRVPERQ